MDIVSVVTTVGTHDDARRLARAMVERGLAACAQIEAIESYYTWKGELNHDPEFRIVCKTTAVRSAELMLALEAMHPYELPAIHIVSLDAVHPPYAIWVAENSCGT
jgi:periplasmic divalent cation tolerance protein